MNADERPYQTLAEFQQAHETLLECFDAGEAAPAGTADDEARERGCLVAMMEPLREFMRRAAAGGAYLYESRERRAAQGLLDYWASLCYGANLDLPRPLLAAHDPALLPQLDEADCPYVGLEAFGERNAANFFGREERVQALLQRLQQERLLVVTGASGSGKSSLVLAGLLPALRAGALDGSAGWCYPPPLVPGALPLHSLLAALLPEEAQDAGMQPWLARLREQPAALGELLGATPALLVVDQFEEVMTLRSADHAADFIAFVAALQSLVDAATPQHRLVLTMRNDVDTQLAREYPELNRRYGAAAFPLVSMDSAQLREAIEGPAQRVGLKFQDGVVDELIRSVVGEDAGLPLLQFSLLALWDRRHGNLITLDALRAVGSPRRAMTVAAEALYAELPPEQQLATANLFLALSRQGEGVAVFRNRVSRRRLHEVGEPNVIDRVVQRFEQARLLRVTRRELPADDLVEVAHEALLRNWDLLQSLFSERRDERERRAFLRKQALKWREANFDDAFLLSGLALRQAREEIERAGMAEVERNFLDKSLQNEEALEHQRTEDAERRLRLAEQEAQAAQRASRSKQALLAAVALALLVLLAAVGVALVGSERAKRKAQDEAHALIAKAEHEQQVLLRDANERVEEAQFKADRIITEAQLKAEAAAAAASAAVAEQARATAQLQRSESVRLMAEAESNVDNDAELAVFYASEAARRDPKLMPRVAPLVIDALRYRRVEQRLPPEPAGADSVLALNPRGDRLLVATEHQLSEWDLEAATAPLRRRSWPLAAGPVRQVAYLGEGGDAAIAGGDAVWLWRREAALRALEPKFAAARLTVSDDGRWLAAVSRDGHMLQVWGLADSKLRLSYKHPDEQPKLNSAMFDAGQALVVGLVPSAATPQALALRFESSGDGFEPVPKSLQGAICKGSNIVFAASGMRLAVLTLSNLCVQDATTLTKDDGVDALRQTTTVDDVLVSPRGRYVVKLQRATGEAVVEELSSGRMLRLQGAFDLSDKRNYENVISVSDTGERLAIKGKDGSVRIYALGAATRELAGRNGVLWVSDDDRWFITRGAVALSKGYELREMAGGRLVRQFAVPQAQELREFSVSRDGRWLQAQGRCDRRGSTQVRAGPGEVAGSTGVQVLVFDLRQGLAAPVPSPCVQSIASSDGLHLLEMENGLAVYSAAAQRVVWPSAALPGQAGAAMPTGMQVSDFDIELGEGGGRFLVRRVAEGQASVEVYRVVGDAAQIERAWQFPTLRGWSASLLGRGRALYVRPSTAAPAGELWDLHSADATRLVVPGRTVVVGASGSVLALRPAPRGPWELRDIATGKPRGSLPGWLRIEPSGSFAYGFNEGRWQVRRLDVPERVLLEGEGEPDSWQFDRQGQALALTFSDSDRVRVYRLIDGALRLESRFYDLRTARLTGGGGYLLTDDGRLVPADGVALLESARLAVAARFGNEQRCQLLMDEAACRQAKARGRALSPASTSP
jgi:energy-coupling factor transporter ATP-binding protein EcfA2